MESLVASKTQSWLSWFFKGLIVLTFLVFIGRLLELQIIKGDYFRVLAEGNRITKIPIEAPRGRILARGGEVLAETIEEEGKLRRVYFLSAAAAHITGYLGETGEDEVKKVDGDCPQRGVRRLGSLTGRMGIEEAYNCRLRGFDGEELVEVDTKGEKVRSLGVRKPAPGEDVKTTIDFNLQKKVYEVFKDAVGAVIVSDGSGQILAFYSSPSFDPSNIQPSLVDDKLPLFNRGISGSYHPGSAFKLVTALAALEEEKIDDAFTYTDTGKVTVNDFSYANWYFTQYGGTEGAIGLERALARSTDTFFYKVGEFVGPDKLAEWANKLDVGVKTGVDLPGEVEGLVPTPQWKEDIKNESWFLGNTYHMAIGQGDVATTPLQVNVMTAAVATGRVCTPYFVEEKGCRDLGVKRTYLETIKNGMVGACATGGTAYPFFDFPASGSADVKVACKTGTAQTQEEDVTHAWFTVYAPSDYPEIVVTVLVEKGGEGSKVAAPIARQLLDYWLLTVNP